MKYTIAVLCLAGLLMASGCKQVKSVQVKQIESAPVAQIAKPTVITPVPQIVVKVKPVIKKVITLDQESRAAYVHRIDGAVFLLYGQDESGSLKMHCTATIYEQHGNVYRLVSASHCIAGDTDEEQQEVAHYFVSQDPSGTKEFLPVKVIAVGNRSAGDDFVILELVSKESLSVIPLGDESLLHNGDRVTNIAGPLGLGKQYFEGYVSDVRIDRPALQAEDVNWNNPELIKIGAGPGSSGSSIISDDQKAIIGILVGHTNSADIGAICLPVSQFKKFKDAVAAGTYKKLVSTPKPEDPGSEGFLGPRFGR